MASRIDDLFQSPEFQNAPLGERLSRVAGIMDEGIYKAHALGDTEVTDTLYKRKQELLAQVGMTRMPGDIGAVENFGNAFTKSWGSFKTNIGFELLKQDHEAAVRYTDELERLNPTRDQGISDDLGSVAAQILPSAIALGAAAVPGGGTAVPIIARVATASMFGASAAGGKRGDIEEFEAKTGQEVGSIQAGFSMAGAAAGELLTEMLGMEAITRTAQATGARIFDKVAMDKLGRLAATGASKEVFNAGLKEALTTGTGRKATLAALGWVGSAGIEGVEEALSQVANNASDIFYKPMADIDPFANVGEAFKGGFVGGLMLGPLAMAVEGTRMSQFRDAQIAAEREGLSELAPLLQAKGLAYTDAMHDAEAWNFPLYGAAKQMAAKAGLELYAVDGLQGVRGLTLPESEAGRRVLLVDRKMAGENLFLQVVGHEMWHGVEQQIGEGTSRAMKREILQASPEYREKYEAAIGEGTDEDTVLDEQFSDLFGTMYLDPAFQQQVALHADEKTAKGIFASLRRVSEYNASVPEAMLRQLNAVAAREGADAQDPRNQAATALFDTINTVLEQSKKADKVREYFARTVAAVQLAKKNQPEAVARLRQEAKQIEEERAAKEKAASETSVAEKAPEPEPAKPIPPPEPPAQPEAPDAQPAPASQGVDDGFAGEQAALLEEMRQLDALPSGRGSASPEAITRERRRIAIRARLKEIHDARGVDTGKLSLDPTKVQEAMDAGMTRKQAIDKVAAETSVVPPAPAESTALADALARVGATGSYPEAIDIYNEVRDSLTDEERGKVRERVSALEKPAAPQPAPTPAQQDTVLPFMVPPDVLYTPKGNIKFRFRWVIRDAATGELLRSGDAGYPEAFQARTRKWNKGAQVEAFERGRTWDTALAHSSTFSNTGAPVTALVPVTVETKNGLKEELRPVMISGHGRKESIDILRESYPQKRAEYDQMVRHYADRLGIDISKMKDARLDREIVGANIDTVLRIAELSNTDVVRGLNPVEQALGEGRTLARRLDLLGKLSLDDLKAQDSVYFLREYAKNVASDEGALYNNAGEFIGFDQLRYALVSTILSQHPLAPAMLKKVIEDSGFDRSLVRRIGDQLGRAATDILNVPGEYAAANDIAEAFFLVVKYVLQPGSHKTIGSWLVEQKAKTEQKLDIQGPQRELMESLEEYQARLDAWQKSEAGKKALAPQVMVSNLHAEIAQFLHDARPGEIRDFARELRAGSTNQQGITPSGELSFTVRSREQVIMDGIKTVMGKRDDGIRASPAGARERAFALPDANSRYARANNIVDAPYRGGFVEGELLADHYGEDPYVYRAEFVDPSAIDVKMEGKTEAEVLAMDTTRQYAQWYSEGELPPAIHVIRVEASGRYLSVDRRRVIAARSAGVSRIPALVEIGRSSEVLSDIRFSPAGDPEWRGGHLHRLRQSREAMADEDALKSMLLPPGVTLTPWVDGKATATFPDGATHDYALGPDLRQAITYSEDDIFNRAFSGRMAPGVHDVLESDLRARATKWFKEQSIPEENREKAESTFHAELERWARKLQGEAGYKSVRHWMTTNPGRRAEGMVEDRLRVIRESLAKLIRPSRRVTDRRDWVNQLYQRVFPERKWDTFPSRVGDAMATGRVRTETSKPIRDYIRGLPVVRQMNPTTEVALRQIVADSMEGLKSRPAIRAARLKRSFSWEQIERDLAGALIFDYARGADQIFGFTDPVSYLETMAQVMTYDFAPPAKDVPNAARAGRSASDKRTPADVFYELLVARQDGDRGADWERMVDEATDELVNEFRYSDSQVAKRVADIVRAADSGIRASPGYREGDTSKKFRIEFREFKGLDYMTESQEAAFQRVWSDLGMSDDEFTPRSVASREAQIAQWTDPARWEDVAIARDILARTTRIAYERNPTPELLALSNDMLAKASKIGTYSGKTQVRLKMAFANRVTDVPYFQYAGLMIDPLAILAADRGGSTDLEEQSEIAIDFGKALGMSVAELEELRQNAALGVEARVALGSGDVERVVAFTARLAADQESLAAKAFDRDDEFIPDDDSLRFSPAGVSRFSEWVKSFLADAGKVARAHAAFTANDARYLSQFSQGMNLSPERIAFLKDAVARTQAKIAAVRAAHTKPAAEPSGPDVRRTVADAIRERDKVKAKRIAKLAGGELRTINSTMGQYVARALPTRDTPEDVINEALRNPEDFATAVNQAFEKAAARWVGEELDESDVELLLPASFSDAQRREKLFELRRDVSNGLLGAGALRESTDGTGLWDTLSRLDLSLEQDKRRGFPLSSLQATLKQALDDAGVDRDALRTRQFDVDGLLDLAMGRIADEFRPRVRAEAARELDVLATLANDDAFDKALAATARADLRYRELLNAPAANDRKITSAEIARAILSGEANWRAKYGEAMSNQAPDALLPMPLMLELTNDALKVERLTPAEFAQLAPDSGRLAAVVGRLTAAVSGRPEFAAFADGFVRSLQATRNAEGIQGAIESAVRSSVAKQVSEQNVARFKAGPDRAKVVSRILADEAGYARALEKNIADLRTHGAEAYGRTQAEVEQYINDATEDLNLLRQRSLERAGLLALVREQMSEMETTFRDFVLGGIANQTASVTLVHEAVAKRLGITDQATKDKLRKGIQGIIDFHLPAAKQKAKEAVSARLSAPKAKRAEALPYERLVSMWRVGMLDDATSTRLVAEKLFNLPEMTDAQADEIRTRVRRIEAMLDEKVDKRNPLIAIEWGKINAALQNWADGFDQSIRGKFKRATDLALSNYVSNITSGPGTWLVANPIGNLQQLGAELTHDITIAARTGPLKVSDMLAGLVRLSRTSLFEGVQAGADAFRTGMASGRLGEKWPEFSLQERRTGQDLIDKYLTGLGLLKYVGRALLAGDTAFYSFAKDSGAFLSLMEKYALEGLTPEQAAERAITDIRADQYLPAARNMANRFGVTDPSVIRQIATHLRDSALAESGDGLRALDRGNDLGRRSTFTHKTDGLFSMISERGLNPILNAIPVGRFIVPFTRIVAAVADTSMEYFAPYAVYNVFKKHGHLATTLKGKTAAELKDLDRVAYDDALRSYQRAQQQLILGAGATILAMIAAALGGDDDEEGAVVWGAGPKDWKKNAQWREAGGRPYSIRLGDRVVSYQLSPLFLALAAVGNARDAVKYEVDPEVGKMSAALWAGFITTASTTTLDQSYVKGLSDLIEMLTEKDAARQQQKGQELLSMTVVSSLVPFANLFRQTYKMIDPGAGVTNREWFKQFLAQSGPLAGNLTRKQNVLGSEVQFDRPVIDTFPVLGSPDPATDEEDARILRFLASRDIWLNLPSSTSTQLLVHGDVKKREYKRLEAEFGGKTMDEGQYYQFLKERGERFKLAFTPLLPDLADASPEKVKEFVDLTMSWAQTQARRSVLGLQTSSGLDASTRRKAALLLREE